MHKHNAHLARNRFKNTLWMVALLAAALCIVGATARAQKTKTPQPEAQAAPATFDWFGVWGGERVHLIFKPAPHLVYLSQYDNDGKPLADLPDYVDVTIRVPGALYGARFVPKKWGGRVELPLKELLFTRETPQLDTMNPGGPAALIVRQWKDEPGGNSSTFRLFRNPKALAPFRARGVYRARVSIPKIRQFAPALRVEGDKAVFDARRYDDQINAPTDVFVLLSLPQGHAFGFVPGARLGYQTLKISLFELDKTPSAKPSAIVGFNGDFDYNPKLMTCSAFYFALQSSAVAANNSAKTR